MHPDIHNCSAIKQLLEDIRTNSVRTPQPYRGLCAATVSRDAVTYFREIVGSTMDTVKAFKVRDRAQTAVKHRDDISGTSKSQGQD